MEEVMARNRRRSSIPRVHWSPTAPEDIEAGDLLPWGVVREKTWGGPIGIDAWRVVVSGKVRPVWLKPKRTVICRRAFERSAVEAPVAGVIASGPPRADDLRSRIRHYVLRQARRAI
jgi:hypothetical protein